MIESSERMRVVFDEAVRGKACRRNSDRIKKVYAGHEDPGGDAAKRVKGNG